MVPPSIIHLFLSQQRWMNDESIFFFSLGRVQLRQHFYQDLFLQVFVVGLSGEIRWSARSSPRHQHLQNQTQRHLRRKLSSGNVAKKKTFSFTGGLENHDNKNKSIGKGSFISNGFAAVYRKSRQCQYIYVVACKRLGKKFDQSAIYSQITLYWVIHKKLLTKHFQHYQDCLE